MARAISQIPATFPYQSYFDTTALSRAILMAGVANPIIDSTRQYAQTKGVGVALHPCSQSPVAIKFKGGDADSAVINLTPGQRVFPGDFHEFEWGLPFGWLGGGTVVLYVIHDRKAEIDFPASDSPIIFQRLRMPILDGVVDAAPVINWPLSFPWSNATRVNGAVTAPQQAAPLFHVIPTNTLMRFNAAAGFIAALDLVLQIRNCDPFDLNSAPDQAAGYANQNHFFPITFNPVLGPNVPAPLWLTDPVTDLAGDFAAVSILDPASGGLATFVDVVRYGRFM